jgi:hypothetical protein
MMKRLYCLIAFILASFASLTSIASETKTEILVVSDNWHGFVDQQGQGFYMDILHRIFPANKFHIELKILPYARALNQVQKDKADLVLGIWANEHPSRQLSQYPVEVDIMDAALPVASNQPTIPVKVHFFNQLRVLSRVGFQVDELLDNPMDYTEHVALEKMVRMLASNRADVLIDYETAMAPIIKELGLEDELIIINNVLTEFVYFGFCSTSKCLALKKYFDQEYLSLHQQGEIKQALKDNDLSPDHHPPLIPLEQVLEQ